MSGPDRPCFPSTPRTSGPVASGRLLVIFYSTHKVKQHFSRFTNALLDQRVKEGEESNKVTSGRTIHILPLFFNRHKKPIATAC